MTSPVRILLLEDNPAYARLVALLLAEEHGDAVAAHPVPTLAAAVAALAAEGADCVVLDLSLPDERGPGVVARMAAAAPGVPLVVLSGDDEPAITAEVLRLGAVAFVPKGRERPELLQVLAACVPRLVGS